MLSPRSTRQIRALFFFFIVIVLSGCGQKGELYLPQQTKLERDALTHPG